MCENEIYPTYDDQPYPPSFRPGRDKNGLVIMLAEFPHGPGGGVKNVWKLDDILSLKESFKQASDLAARILPQQVRVSRIAEDGQYIELIVVKGNSCHYSAGKHIFQTPSQLASRYEPCMPT